MRVLSYLAGATCVMAAASASAAPLMNGNFESNNGLVPPAPSYWATGTTSTSGSYAFQYQPTGGKAGTAGVNVQNSGSNGRNYWQSSPFDVQAGLTYTLSFDYKSSAILSYPRLDFWTGPGTTGWLNHMEFGDEIRYGSESLLASSNWTSRSFQFTVPTNATQATLTLNANAQWANTSFDNVSVSVPEPASLGLLAGAMSLLGRRRHRAR